jgi:N-acetylglucosamine-6-phosphate deacetylase
LSTLEAADYRDGSLWRVSFDGPAPNLSLDPGERWLLVPPLLDLQVNGFAGIDFNDPRLTPEGVSQACGAMRSTGVARFLPTVITASERQLARCLGALRIAREQDAGVADAMLGVHLEGPYISGVTGPRGAHLRRHVRDPDEASFARLQDAAGGLVRMITIAPEREGALDFIARRVAEGIVVAIGHTEANGDEISAAVDAGATLSTHLGNATHDLLPRHDNYVQAQLGDDRLVGSFIADGQHLPPAVLRSFLRAKGFARSILVTDGTAASGAPAGTYGIGGRRIETRTAGGAARLPDGRMAGSSLSLDRAVHNVRDWCGVSLADAVDMASVQPARVVGHELGVSEDATEVLLAVDRDGALLIDQILTGVSLRRPVSPHDRRPTT